MLAFMGVFLKRDNEIKQTKELDFFVDELIISNQSHDFYLSEALKKGTHIYTMLQAKSQY